MMRQFFFKLFSDTPTGSGVEIESFNLWHFGYLILIFGLILLAYFLLRDKSAEAKNKLLSGLALFVIISYVSDYLFHDFVYASYNAETGEYTAAGLNMDKLPFHICTTMGIVITFAQFNRRLERFLEPIAAVAIVGPLMYLVYPSTGVGGEPWCYRVMQTVFFHGALMAWGILTVAFGKTSLRWKNVWKAEILLVMITIWAKFGCEMLEYNWMFLNYNPFGIAALDLPWLLPILVPTAIFAVVTTVYGINSGLIALSKKIADKKSADKKSSAA